MIYIKLRNCLNIYTKQQRKINFENGILAAYETGTGEYGAEMKGTE
jgi:hypothetical protein